MLLWILEEPLLSLNRKLYLFLRHLRLLLREAMREDHCLFPMKEVEQAVVDARVLGAKLVDIVSEEVSLRATKLVPKLSKPLDTNDTFVLGFIWKAVEPLQERYASVLLSVKDYPCSRHSASCSVAILRPTVKDLKPHKLTA